MNKYDVEDAITKLEKRVELLAERVRVLEAQNAKLKQTSDMAFAAAYPQGSGR